ncbi:hypothetical protein BTR23_13935 [Alkalihalophilus pseudofirmus]|nr:hypothetical protein BTR23_13935 [Alkalihalophilus pseudofirmus]
MRFLFFDNNPVLMKLLPNGFRDAGHDVMVFSNVTPKNIKQTIKEFRPDLIITQGWAELSANHQFQKLIGTAAKEAGVPLIYWSVEDPIWTNTFVLPLLMRMKPDFVFTICQSKVGYFRQRGFKCAHLDFGYRPNRSSVIVPEEKTYDIAIVANTYNGKEDYYNYRNQTLKLLLLPLIKYNIRVDIWGEGWETFGKKNLGIDIPKDWIHEPLPYSEIEKIYHSSKIILSPQNYPHQLTLRTYDILGSGGFLLTVDTPAVRKLFKPGKDLVVSSSSAETYRLTKYYLQRPGQRNQISEQGKMAVMNHTYEHRANYIIGVLKQHGIL